MADSNRIQQIINDNIADLPTFYSIAETGNNSLKYYISRVDQGVSSLGWTQVQAFTYFRNSIKSSAANWLDTWLLFNRNAALKWANVQPHFFKAFGDKSHPMVFANPMFNIKLSNYNSNLFDYSGAIWKRMALHTKKCLASQLGLLDGNCLTAAQQVLCKQSIDQAYREVYDKFCK